MDGHHQNPRPRRMTMSGHFSVSCDCIPLKTQCKQLIDMKAEEHFKSGKQLYESNDYEGAITNYTKTIQLNPDHTSAWYNRGFAWSKKGEFRKAIGLNEAIPTELE